MSNTLKKTTDKTISIITKDNKKYIKLEYLDDKRKIYSLLKEKNIKGIPKIFDISFSDRTIILEEFIDGQTLYDKISSGEELNKSFTKDFSIQLANIVLSLHNQNIIHRDIKPSNIMIDNSGKVYLIDFDIARIYSENSNRDTTLLGTLGYAPPEQFGFSSTNFKSDIYSFGMTLQDILLASSSQNIYKNIIKKCTAFDPSKRYSSMNKVIHAIMLYNHKKYIITFFIVTAIILSSFISISLLEASKIPSDENQPSNTEITQYYNPEQSSTNNTDELIDQTPTQIPPNQDNNINNQMPVESVSAKEKSIPSTQKSVKSPVATIKVPATENKNIIVTPTPTPLPTQTETPIQSEIPTKKPKFFCKDCGKEIDSAGYCEECFLKRMNIKN